MEVKAAFIVFAGVLLYLQPNVVTVLMLGLLWGAHGVLMWREDNRERMKARPIEERRADDHLTENTDPFFRGSGLHSWMRGGRS